MVDLDADAHQYRLDEIEGLKEDIDRLIAKCFEQHERIEALEAALRLYAGFESNGIKWEPIDDKGGVARAALAGEKKDDAG